MASVLSTVIPARLTTWRYFNPDTISPSTLGISLARAKNLGAHEKVTPTEYSTPSLIVTARQLLNVHALVSWHTWILLSFRELSWGLFQIDNNSVFQSGGAQEEGLHNHLHISFVNQGITRAYTLRTSS